MPVLILCFATLLHFMLVFPFHSSFMDKPNAQRILYGPAVLFTLYVLFLMLLQPDATSTLNVITNIFFGVFFGGYLIMSAIVRAALVRSEIRLASYAAKYESVATRICETRSLSVSSYGSV